MRWEVNSVPDIDIASFTVSGFRFGATSATQGTGSRIYLQLDSNLSGSEDDLTFEDEDLAYTSGDGGYFNPGIPIGRIKKENNSIYIEPLNDLHEVQYINIFINQFKDF